MYVYDSYNHYYGDFNFRPEYFPITLAELSR